LCTTIALGDRHPDHSAATSQLAAGRDGGIAAHTDPQHLEPAEVLTRPLLRRRIAEEDVADEDPGAGPGHRRDAGQPRHLELAEALPERDLALLAERHARHPRPSATAARCRGGRRRRG